MQPSSATSYHSLNNSYMCRCDLICVCSALNTSTHLSPILSGGWVSVLPICPHPSHVKAIFLQSFIRITGFGVFLFPFYLLISMVVCTAACSWCWLPFIRCLPFSLAGYFCSSPAPAATFFTESALSLHWCCIALAGQTLTWGQEALAPRRLIPLFSGMAGSSVPSARGTGGRTDSRVVGAARPLVTVQGAESRPPAGLAAACALPSWLLPRWMTEKHRHLRELTPKFPV